MFKQILQITEHYLHLFQQPSPKTKYHRLRGLNNRNSFSNGHGGSLRAKCEQLWSPQRFLSLDCLWLPALCPHCFLPCGPASLVLLPLLRGHQSYCLRGLLYWLHFNLSLLRSNLQMLHSEVLAIGCSTWGLGVQLGDLGRQFSPWLLLVSRRCTLQKWSPFYTFT